MKEKKYSLRKTWENCLAMWKSIAEEWQRERSNPSRLKIEWLDKHRISHYIRANCFFCHYQETHPQKKFSSQTSCGGCPAAEVAPRFDCFRSGWKDDPVKFYRTLRRMYAKWKKLHNSPR